MSNEQRLRFPLPLDDYRHVLNDGDLARLEQLNQRFAIVKADLKQLETDKGIASRRIGEAKKAGEPIDALKQQIQALSTRIAERRAQLGTLTQEAEALLQPNEPAADPAPRFPPHLARQPAQEATGGDSRIVQADDTLAAAWDTFVQHHPASNAYHQYAFRRVIEASFGHRTLYLAALDHTGALCGILPAVQLKSRTFGNYVVAVPFFNYGGALGRDDAIERQLMEALNQQADALGASHVEYRDTAPRPGLPQKTEKASLILKLPRQPEQLWQDIGSKVRAQIKKADSFDLVFRTGKLELLDDFYKVFAINMRDLGTPVYGKAFFANLLREPSLNTRLALVYRHGKPVSCGFLLSYHGTQEIPWASTLRTANAFNANMFMYWNILRQAIESGHEYFDFGRSSKDAGTFKFKTQWGAQPAQLYWHYWLKGGGELPALNPDNPKFKLAIAVWQRLPVWLTTLIGPHVVKNLP